MGTGPDPMAELAPALATLSRAQDTHRLPKHPAVTEDIAPSIA